MNSLVCEIVDLNERETDPQRVKHFQELLGRWQEMGQLEVEGSVNEEIQTTNDQSQIWKDRTTS